MNRISLLKVAGFSFCAAWLGASGLISSSIVRARGTTPRIVDFSGRVTITTTKDGKWTQISIPSADARHPLAAAFAVQYAQPTAYPINFVGEASVHMEDLALEIVPPNNPGWTFTLTKEQAAPLPATPTMLVNVAGIAWYETKALSKRASLNSHADFVTLLARASTAEPIDCADGGQGASSCGIQGNGGCSVTCRDGYYACCNPGSCKCYSVY